MIMINPSGAECSREISSAILNIYVWSGDLFLKI